MDMSNLPLPRWEISLIGEERDLRHLAEHFGEFAWPVYKDQSTGQTLMVAKGFPEDASPGDVLARAEAQVKVLSGVLMSTNATTKRLSAGGVTQRATDGKRYVYAVATAIGRAHVECHAEALRRDASGKFVPIPSPPPRSVTLAELAQADPVVEKVMRLKAGANDWSNLFPLFEALKRDAGGDQALAKKGWASLTQQKRFRRSVNSPSVAGDAARHGVEDGAPPANPMTLAEAREFVDTILDAWLTTRLAGAAGACHNPASP